MTCSLDDCLRYPHKSVLHEFRSKRLKNKFQICWYQCFLVSLHCHSEDCRQSDACANLSLAYFIENGVC